MPLRILTNKFTPIKLLFEALKELVTDAHLVATARGLSLTQYDASNACLVLLRLGAAHFGVYECEPECSYMMTINVRHLAKVLGRGHGDETLEVRMGSPTSEKVTWIITKPQGRRREYAAPVLPPCESINMADVSERDPAHLQANDFRDTIADIKTGDSERVRIEIDRHCVQFSASSHIGDIKVVLPTDNRSDGEQGVLAVPASGSETTPPDPNSPYYMTDEYLQSYLHAITKAANMCHHLSLSILPERNNTLLIGFRVGDLGTFDVFLAANNSGDEPRPIPPPPKRPRPSPSEMPPPSITPAEAATAAYASDDEDSDEEFDSDEEDAEDE